MLQARENEFVFENIWTVETSLHASSFTLELTIKAFVIYKS